MKEKNCASRETLIASERKDAMGQIALKPYYQDSAVTIYHGDCREVLPELEIDPGLFLFQDELIAIDLIFSDPVWPNFTAGMGTVEPTVLFAECQLLFARTSPRLIVWLGCDSDPRFLASIDPSFSYWNTIWIPRTPPFFKGPKFIGADIAYAFGEFPSPEGRRVCRQQFQFASSGKRENDHPCPRNQRCCTEILENYSQPSWTILDPFCGSGTTLLSAKATGRRAIGIDIEERYCEIAAGRMEQEMMDFGASAICPQQMEEQSELLISPNTQ